jgi:hypothetical protein
LLRYFAKHISFPSAVIISPLVILSLWPLVSPRIPYALFYLITTHMLPSSQFTPIPHPPPHPPSPP